MTPKQLHTLFSILHNVDLDQLEKAGVIEPGAVGGSDWKRFNNDIGTFVLKLNDEPLQKLVDLLKDQGLRTEVKRLDWRDMTYQGAEEWLAHTHFDSYTVKHESQFKLPFVRRPYGAGPSNFATADEAKTACEADFHQRVLASLVQP